MEYKKDEYYQQTDRAPKNNINDPRTKYGSSRPYQPLINQQNFSRGNNTNVYLPPHCSYIPPPLSFTETMFPPPNYPCFNEPPPLNYSGNWSAPTIPNPPSFSYSEATCQPHFQLTERQKQLDKNIINNFVKKKQQNTTTTISLHSARTDLRQIAQLLNVLKQLKLNTTQDNEDIETRIAQYQTQINNLMSNFNDKTLNILKTKMKRRQSKRKQQRKKRTILQSNRSEMLKNREKINKSIDDVIRKKEEEVEKMKIEKSLKLQADNVLRDVNKKMADGKKMIQLVEALKKLRDLKIQQEKIKTLPVETEVFHSVLDHVDEMWQKQMVSYKKEEDLLKSFLQDSADEKVKKWSSKLVNNFNEWEVALFGDSTPVNESDYYKMSEIETNSISFLDVRRAWDQFLTPCGSIMTSSIPPGWVLPTSPQDNDWRSLRLKTT